MNKAFKVSRATAEVDVTAILSGSNPAIKVIYDAKNSRGAARQFVRQIPVPDAELFRRIQANVKEGERIQVTTVNEWYENGHISYLADFGKTEEVIPTAVETIIKNGAFSLGHSEIREMAVSPSVQNSTNKAKS